MNTLLVIVATILTYYVLGWLTVWAAYLLSTVEVLLVGKNRHFGYDTPSHIFWAWPLVALVILTLCVFYIPYLLLIKLTPKGP